MLTKLRIKNYKSFKKNTIIDFTKTNYKILSKTNIHENTLKGGLFIGANASGKTNVIKAIKKLLELLFAEKITNIEADNCLFSKESNMILEYSFLINQAVIKYHIEYDIKKEILIEKLFLDEKLLLNRIGTNGETILTENKVFNELDNESLLLREIYFNTKFRGHDILKEWFDFLLNSVVIDAYYGGIFSPGKKTLIINDFLEEHGVNNINAFFQKLNFKQKIEYSNTSSGSLITINSNDEKSVFFKRKGIGEPIPYQLESLGNKNLLNLLPSFFHVINNNGMLIIDEFSSGFHNQLEELLLRYFMQKSKQSQIFIVSHSTNLLSNSLLRPDQIYLIEFKDMKGSIIKRASEEKPREAQNIEKMYLSGVFGGIPAYNDEELNYK
ncbi:AAA family ATPase [Abyssisolibacter fermentans]|uniref:AAA family ATPase n=1 Tax=Abyssisolibacter fermentans TaxID=1766203 RepID=UPI000837740F|nr:AAA family ATPase [Abyssisolibacter fermentans]